MDERVRDFVEYTAQDIVGLDVALFYQANPDTFDTPIGIARRTHRAPDQVSEALDRLANRGILERHPRDEGKWTCYALSRNLDVWNLLCLVSEAYLDDPDSRKEIVRMLVARQRRRASGQDPQSTGQDRPCAS